MIAHVATLADLHELAAPRREIYALLARLFRGPAAREDRAKVGDPAVLDHLGAVYGPESVAPWARAASAPGDGLARREERDFSDLLATPSRRFVKPWESVHRNERRVGDKLVRGLLCGASAVAAAQVYAAAGVQFAPEGLADLPDNACVELAFLEHLCEAERAAAAEGRAADAAAALVAQHRFVGEHLVAWLPALGDAIAAAAETELYRGLGTFLKAFVLAEDRLLAGR